MSSGNRINRIPITSLSLEDVVINMNSSKNVINHLTINLPLGKIYWVHGGSGSGKSTLLRLLSGLQMPNDGEYLVNGLPVGEMSFEEFLPYRLNLGFGFSQGGLLNNRTLKENLVLPLLYHNECEPEEANRKVDRIASHFRITKFIAMRPAEVPNSVQRLISVMRAFVMQPQVLILDEPFNGLGADSARLLFEWIAAYLQGAPGRTFFIATDNETKIQGLNPESIILEEGRLTSVREAA